MAIKFLISTSHDPKYNLATEQFLTFDYPSKEAIIFFWQNNNTIVVGRNQNTFAEVAVNQALKDNVNIIRRNTGGGTVFQDLGNICFSVIVNNDQQSLNYQQALQPIIEFLNKQNIPAQFSGRNDLVVNGFKISGNASLKTKERTLIHGTLLFDVDLTKLQQYLTVNEEKMKHQKVKSKAARVKNIAEFYKEQGVEIDVKTFFEKLVNYYLTLDETQPIVLTAHQLGLIESIKQTKYDPWEWTFGKNADYQASQSRYLEGKGFVQIQSSVKHGVIEKIKIFGDFLGFGGTETVENLLVGRKLEPNDLEQVLNTVDIQNIFGENFTNKDILNILFS